MKSKGYLVLRIILLAGIIGTLLFTFNQSLLPPEESSEVSDDVRGFLETIIPPDTPVGEYVHKNVRKIAHFVEYLVLGTFVSLYVIFFMPAIDSKPKERIRFSIYSLVLAPIVGLFDETLQIFSGRGPAITDVWIDTAGFFSSAVTVYAVFYIIMYFKNRKSQRIQG